MIGMFLTFCSNITDHKQSLASSFWFWKKCFRYILGPEYRFYTFQAYKEAKECSRYFYCFKRSNKKWASDPLSDLSSSFRSRKERCVVVVWRVMDSSVYWIFTKCDPSSVLMLRFDNFQYALALCALCRRSMYRSCIDHRPCAAYQNIHNAEEENKNSW